MFGKLEFTTVNSDFPFPLNSTHAHLDSKLYFSNGEAFLNSYPLLFRGKCNAVVFFWVVPRPGGVEKMSEW